MIRLIYQISGVVFLFSVRLFLTKEEILENWDSRYYDLVVSRIPPWCIITWSDSRHLWRASGFVDQDLPYLDLGWRSYRRHVESLLPFQLSFSAFAKECPASIKVFRLGGGKRKVGNWPTGPVCKAVVGSLSTGCGSQRGAMEAIMGPRHQARTRVVENERWWLRKGSLILVYWLSIWWIIIGNQISGPPGFLGSWHKWHLTKACLRTKRSNHRLTNRARDKCQ